MLLEAFEILQSAGQDDDTFVTDFAIYKIITILTVYLPMIISTFLLSQEYLGDKIQCFAPENFTEPQAEALHEYCWTNGFWISDGTPPVKSLYTQPHRYYPLYLPLQVIITMSPVILWNIMTKTQLLAILKGTEEFLEDLLEMMTHNEDLDQEEVAIKVQRRMRQFHNTCVAACRTSKLAQVGCFRVLYEITLDLLVTFIQFAIYDHQHKVYHCSIPELYPDEIMCTVPTLDLLDMIWSINTTCIVLSLIINCYALLVLYRIHYSNYQPMFYNNLPYGDTDDFNENVVWENRWVKDSYILLTRLFLENNPIMTKSYVLQAMKPLVQNKEDNEEQQVKEKKTLKDVGRRETLYENALECVPQENGGLFNQSNEPMTECDTKISENREKHAHESSSSAAILKSHSSESSVKDSEDIIQTKENGLADIVGDVNVNGLEPYDEVIRVPAATSLNDGASRQVRHRVTITTSIRPGSSFGVVESDKNAGPGLKDYTMLSVLMAVALLFLAVL